MRARWALACAPLLAAAPLALETRVARAAQAAPTTDPVACAVHVAHVRDGEARWRSTFHLRPGRTRGAIRIALAEALPADAITTDGRPILDSAGDVVAIEAAPGDALVVSSTERLGALDRVERLSPPFASGEGPQLVQIVGADELRFEPAPAGAFERREGATVAVDLSDAERADCEARTASARAPDAPLVELRASTRGGAGLRGALTTATSRRRPAIVLVTGATVLVLAALALSYRRLARAAKIEAADAALDAAFAKLGRGAGG